MTLDIVNVEKTYATPVLDGFSMTAESSEIIGITGSNGSGKTTLLNIIAGLEKADSGSVWLNDRPTENGDIAIMPQNPHLIPVLTVKQNLVLPLKLQGYSAAASEKLMRTGIRKMKLEKYTNCYPYELSGGTEQKTVLLRTALFGTKIILLDEPFSAMDNASRLICCDYIQALADTGKIIIISLHRASDAKVCDRLINIRTCSSTFQPAL